MKRWIGWMWIVVGLLLPSCTTRSGDVDVSARSSAIEAMPGVARPGGAVDVAGTSLIVTVREVDVRMADVAEDVAPWIPVFFGERRLDLVDMASAEVFLASITVPLGQVTAVRLILADDVMFTTGGVSQAVRCPSCSESGLKIFLPDETRVTAGGQLHLTLDFDLGQSLVAEGKGYMFRPVIHLDHQDQR